VLRELHISGLGVIDDLDLDLDPGLNVLTGETGAGKTMVTVGLSLALGQRGSSSLVRPGSKSARVQARFDAPLPPAAEEWAEDGELVLARGISAEGKSSVRIGGQIATVGALSALAPDLVEVHGQHSAQRLLQASAQTAFLDRFRGDTHLETLDEYRRIYRRLREIRTRLDELDALARSREREIDLLAYQVREIEAAGLQPGEEGSLANEESRLGNAERLAELAGAAAAGLSDDGGGLDALRAAAAGLDQAAAMDPDTRELAERAASLAEEAGELARELRGYGERRQADPVRLDEIRQRLQVVKALERKYGEDEPAVLEFLDQARNRLQRLGSADDERLDLQAEAGERQSRVGDLAERLSSGRSVAAPELSAALERELHELGMAGASIQVSLDPLDEPGPTGAEGVEMLFAGGPGQASLPLSRAASGGELSRAMLACRSVLADLDEVPTLVFDEVDAGIGGRAGVAVGRRLARIAATRQVLVVTHLPQIASFADRHIRVLKRGGSATVGVLEDRERVEELSRMLSGLPGSDSAATHAEELLSEAGREKASSARVR
jgi:DNA repair protein RecN (Recombination protein N)